jgi:hypothetical protein
MACCWLPAVISEAFCTASCAFIVKLLKFIYSTPQKTYHITFCAKRSVNIYFRCHFGGVI